MPNAIAMKVLVVDDQTSVRQMTRITLEQIGIRHIHEAENGIKAMETAAVQPLDLIISDYNMPEMEASGCCARCAVILPRAKCRSSCSPAVGIASSL
jgi:Response regulator containing a CheY-like receiver domain and an HD-GYP domain